MSQSEKTTTTTTAPTTVEEKTEHKEEKKDEVVEEEEEEKKEEVLHHYDKNIALATASAALNEMEIIREEIAEKQPLVSHPKPLEELLKDFKDHSNYSRQIENLINSKQHSSYRQLRADGNCFYRAFLLGLFENIEKTRNEKLLQIVTKHVSTSCDRLLKFEYEQLTLEEFYDVFMEELILYQSKISSQESSIMDGSGRNAVERLSNDMHSNYLIFWARMLTSLYMLENEKHFSQFVQEKTFREFLQADVEAIHAEADHPQSYALAMAIGVPIRVYCLENIDTGGPQVVTIPENGQPVFDLLYRPGHYDLLYRKT